MAGYSHSENYRNHRIQVDHQEAPSGTGFGWGVTVFEAGAKDDPGEIVATGVLFFTSAIDAGKAAVDNHISRLAPQSKQLHPATGHAS